MQEPRWSRPGNGDALRAKVTKNTGNAPGTVAFVTLTGLLNDPAKSQYPHAMENLTISKSERTI